MIGKFIFINPTFNFNKTLTAPISLWHRFCNYHYVNKIPQNFVYIMISFELVSKKHLLQGAFLILNI